MKTSSNSQFDPFVWRPAVNESEKVLEASDGWLFLHHDTNRTLDYSSGKISVDDKFVVQWQRLLETRAAWCSQRNIAYSFLVAPSKETVYPEKLPGFTLAENRLVRRLLARWRSGNAPCALTYPLEELLAARAAREVFPKTESHWDYYGAYIAYKAWRRDFAAFGGGALGDFPDPVFTSDRISGDLGIKYRPPKTSNCWNVSIPGQPFEITGSSYYGYKEHVLLLEQPDETTLPSAIAFHDSFLLPMLPYLGRTFRRLVCVHSPTIDFALIEEEKPDVVLQQIAERFMARLPEDWRCQSFSHLIGTCQIPSRLPPGMPYLVGQKPPADWRIVRTGNVLNYRLSLTRTDSNPLRIICQLTDGQTFVLTSHGWREHTTGGWDSIPTLSLMYFDIINMNVGGFVGARIFACASVDACFQLDIVHGY